MSEAAELIQKRMEAVRCHLAGDVDEVVRNTRQMFDWQEYVRQYPWAFMGAAAAVGYLVVPKRVEITSPDVHTLLELAKRNQLVVQTNPKAEKQQGVMGALLGIAANTLLRAAVAYVGQQAGKLVGEQAAAESR